LAPALPVSVLTPVLPVRLIAVVAAASIVARFSIVEPAGMDPDSQIEQAVDLGFVGEPEVVDTTILDTACKAGMIPIVAPIAADREGQTYNINADTMAGAIAAALGAARLFLLTDVPGVLDGQGKLLTDLTPADIARLKADGTISGGMIPKLETCVKAVEAGCEAAVVLDGRVGHAMLLEFFTSRGAGTLVRAG
jgi:acetylglutamate kinase